MRKLVPLLLASVVAGCATPATRGTADFDLVPASEAELRPDPKPVTLRDVAAFTNGVMSTTAWFAMEMLKTGAEVTARMAP